jgi:LmbE family N-acetylglucosaminyl deacetylase
MFPAMSPPAEIQRVLLAVFAHPDDESFGVGGTLARYAAEGVEVWLICATDGNAGTVDAEMLEGYASTSQLRAAELCCAAQALGLRGVDWLGYRDSGMAGSPENQHPESLVQAPMEVLVGEIVVHPSPPPAGRHLRQPVRRLWPLTTSSCIVPPSRRFRRPPTARATRGQAAPA